MVFKSFNERQTYDFARKFAASLKGGEIITLKGDLGAGKTVFTKGLAAGLNIQEDVLSPTFVIMNEYAGKTLNLYHFDAYRIGGGDELVETGLSDYFGKKDGVCVVEWAENILDALKSHALVRIEISYCGETSREINIQ